MRCPARIKQSIPGWHERVVEYVRADIANELLEALAALLLAADNLEIHAPCVDGLSNLEIASDKARAAIAKAKGE